MMTAKHGRPLSDAELLDRLSNRGYRGTMECQNCGHQDDNGTPPLTPRPPCPVCGNDEPRRHIFLMGLSDDELDFLHERQQ